MDIAINTIFHFILYSNFVNHLCRQQIHAYINPF